MVLKKQTVWLLTMLSLMVVLSAYYLYNPPLDGEELTQDAGEVEQAEDNEAFTEIDFTNLDELGDDDWIDTFGDLNADFDYTVFDQQRMDYFLGHRMDRNDHRAKQIEDYQYVIASSESNAQMIAEAKHHVDHLREITYTEEKLETMIKSDGYQEAVVIVNDEKVDVLIGAKEDLETSEAVKIIHMVQEQLNVPGNRVRVSYK